MTYFEDQIQSYLLFCEKQKNLSHNSIRAYKIDMQQFIDFIKGYSSDVNTIRDINKFLLKDYIKSLLLAYKPKTCKRKIACIKAFFNHLEFEDIIDINPMRKIRTQIREPQQLPKTLKYKEVQALFQFLYRKLQEEKHSLFSRFNLLKHIAALELLFATGMRVGELCHLSDDSIDFDQSLIRVLGKGDKERIVYITSPDVLQIIKAYIKLRNQICPNASLLFINWNKKRLKEDSIRRLLKTLARRLFAGKRITPHMFRHTFASLLLEAGMGIKHIQELLGHSSISTTQIYLHLSNAAIKAALAIKHPRLRPDFMIPISCTM